MYMVRVYRNVPFDKDELNAILKFGTEDLFKEDDKEEDKALKVSSHLSCDNIFINYYFHYCTKPM